MVRNWKVLIDRTECYHMKSPQKIGTRRRNMTKSHSFLPLSVNPTEVIMSMAWVRESRSCVRIRLNLRW